MKNELRFNDNGKFRILMLSDMHSGSDCNPKMIKGIEALVEEAKPDFVMLGGDQCLCVAKEKIKPYFEKIIEPILKRNIPWAAIFGNHDRECGIDIEEEMEIYETIKGFVGEKGPKDLSGTGNYIIPILSSKDDSVKYRIWAMDSHRGHESLIDKFHIENASAINLPFSPDYIVNQSMPYPDQVVWYYNNSKRFEEEDGKIVPGIMFMHIMLPEYLYVSHNPEETNAVGMQRESVQATLFNTGLFSFALERQDIKGFFFGHDHLNTLQGEYCGITMSCDGSIGYNMSTHDDMRGGRIIDLSEDGSMHTRMLYLIDLLGKDAFRDPDYFEGGSKYNIRKFL